MNCDDCPSGECPRSDAFDDAAQLSAAAEAIRRARRALCSGTVDCDLITQLEETCNELPNRCSPQRMLIELLLDRGELGRADRLIAQALLAWPRDRKLVLLRCRLLILMTEFRAAVSELHFWLATEPWDGAAHDLAGEAAALDNDHELAAGHFALAASHTRTRRRRRWLLARAHIESAQFIAAEQWLADVGRPCPRLEGLLAARRGQLLEASELLSRAAANHNETPLARQIITCELLDVRRQLGNAGALKAAIDRITLCQPLAWSAAAESLLSIGRSASATLMAGRLQRKCRRHALAGHVMVVGCALGNRPRAAGRSMRRLNQQHVNLNTDVMARLWRNGLLSQIMLQQRDARQSGADPHFHRLQPLLERANAVLEQTLRGSTGGRSDARNSRLLQLRNTCQTALGRPLAGSRSIDQNRTGSSLRIAA